MKMKRNKFKCPFNLILVAALVILMIQVLPVKVVAGETGTGSSTIYYNIQLKTDTSFNNGDELMLATTSDRANTNYIGFSLPTGMDARGTIASVDGTWDTSYSPIYGLIVSLRSAQMDEHNGWIAWTGSAWQYHCTGGSDRGIYYAYTVQSSSFNASNVTISENKTLSGTVSPADLTVQIETTGKELTLSNSDYTFTDNVLNPTNGDCTYSVNINGVAITKFNNNLAVNTITTIPNLTDTQKTHYIAELSSAVNDSEVTAILNDARAKAAANVAKSEIDTLTQANKDIINGLTHLTDSQKLTFCNVLNNEATTIKNNIDTATTVTDVSTLKTNGINVINTKLNEDIAHDFVKGFLTGNDGSIYKNINSLNVDQILSGQTPWDSLTETQKGFVNDTIDFENVLTINTYPDYVTSVNAFVKERSDLFINRYLQVKDLIHNVATIKNYQQILNGESLWNEMSNAEKVFIDKILLENGSKTYNELLDDAKIIKAELETVSTGDKIYLLPFILLILLSSAIATVVLLYHNKIVFNK